MIVQRYYFINLLLEIKWIIGRIHCRLLLHTKPFTIACQSPNHPRFCISSPRNLPPSIQTHNNTITLNPKLNETADLSAKDTAVNIPSLLYILRTDVPSDIQIETNISWQKLYK